MTENLKTNNPSSKLESSSIKDKMRELTTVFTFTAAAAMLSLALMDALVFPLAWFSINNVNIFNSIFKRVLGLSCFLALFLLLVSRIRRLRAEGFSGGSILKYLLKRPFQYMGLFMFFLLVSAVLLLFLYILFSSNYYYLHRATGGI